MDGPEPKGFAMDDGDGDGDDDDDDDDVVIALHRALAWDAE